MYIDNQKILCKSEPTNKSKIYTQLVDGYQISDYDKTIFVYHKKQIKEIQLKDLGNNMSIFYIQDQKTLIKKNLSTNGVYKSLTFFQGFDEEIGKKYYFIYKFPQNKLTKLNQNLQKLGIKNQASQTEKGIIFSELNNQNTELNTTIEILSFLFGMTLLYGKFDIKNEDLKSAKIHINLFGQYLSQKDFLDNILNQIQKQGLFIKTSTQNNDNGTIYDITITDYEILQIFANFLKPIEKISQISKYNYMQTAIEKLLTHEPKLQNLLETKTVKLLTK